MKFNFAICILLFSHAGNAQFTPNYIRKAFLKDSAQQTPADTNISRESIELVKGEHLLLNKGAPSLHETDLNGNEIHIGEKGKIQVISFGHIHCGPCLLEIPQLNKLYLNYQNDSSVEIISVSLSSREELIALMDTATNDESMRTAQEMSGGGQMLYPVIPNAKIESLRYLVFNYPTTFITNTRGEISFVAKGFTLHRDPDYFYKKLKKMIETVRSEKEEES